MAQVTTLRPHGRPGGPRTFSPKTAGGGGGTGTLSVDMEFSAGTWTEVTGDVLADPLIRISYGITGNSPKDRVASSGGLKLVLNNGDSNSGGLQGYYSPNHTNQRSGFTYGTRVRVMLKDGATLYYKFIGKLCEINPEPGEFRNERTHCVACDWIDEAASHTIRDVSIQEDKRSDELITSLLATMPTDSQPTATEYDTGNQVFRLAFNDLRSGEKLLGVLAKVIQSEFGFLAVIGDTSTGGKLRVFNRHSRANITSSVTLSNTMVDMKVPSTLDNVYNRSIVTTHPHRVGTGATVLARLETETVDARVSLGPSESQTFWLSYRDYENSGRNLIGGVNPLDPNGDPDKDEQDYAFSSRQDGYGLDLTSDLSVTTTYYSSTVKMVVTNNGSGFGFITKLQSRGLGVFDYSNVQHESVTVKSYGEREVKIDLPYNEDPNVGQGLADFITTQYDTLTGQIDSVEFIANDGDALWTQALAREPGDKITLSETVTGVSSQDAFIQSVKLTIRQASDGPQVTCKWGLAPDVEGSFWILGSAAAHALGTDSVLGYA